MHLPIPPPVKPMLAKAVHELPPGDPGELFFEPKWDGFRCIVFRDGDEVELGSRNERPFTRYFPELLDPVRRCFPAKAVLDGEIVVPTPAGLDFDALGQRIHPAESRVRMLAEKTPAAFLAFDVLAMGDEDLTGLPFQERRARLEAVSAAFTPPIHLTPTTTDRALAAEWLARFTGSGLDGVMAKPAAGVYVPDKRVQFKVKLERTADCVVAGYRMHASGDGVGSLLLGLYDDADTLHHVGVAASFVAAERPRLLDQLAQLRLEDPSEHPWGEWAVVAQPGAPGGEARMPGAPHRWAATRQKTGKDMSWTALDPVLVAEVRYEHATNGRFRGTTRLNRWRPDREPSSCRLDQLEPSAGTTSTSVRAFPIQFG